MVKTRPIAVLLLGILAGASLVGAILVAGLPGTGDSSSSAAANTYPCSHMGGGVWQESWNNSSGAGPSHVWVPEPGHWWAGYNNSTGAVGGMGWGTPGTSTPTSQRGWTYLNLTNDSGVVEAMMQWTCADPASPLPWHYDFSTQQVVRDP